MSGRKTRFTETWQCDTTVIARHYNGTLCCWCRTHQVRFDPQVTGLSGKCHVGLSKITEQVAATRMMEPLSDPTEDSQTTVLRNKSTSIHRRRRSAPTVGRLFGYVLRRFRLKLRRYVYRLSARLLRRLAIWARPERM